MKRNFVNTSLAGAALILCMSLAACGGNSDKQESTAQVSVQASETPAAETSGAAAETSGTSMETSKAQAFAASKSADAADTSKTAETKETSVDTDPGLSDLVGHHAHKFK
jgi:hypothetical protein